MKSTKGKNMSDIVFGFVGLGRMGAPMTRRLLNSGHEVVVYDVADQAMQALVSAGAERATTARDIAERADVVFVSLPNPEIVQAVALGPSGLIEGTRAKHVVDFSTIGPRAAKILFSAFDDRQISYIDAPVSGGVKGASDGTLAVMVSCPNETFAFIEPVVKIFGKVFHLGEGAGQAQTMKLANNLLAAAALAISAEAVTMGVKAGIDPKVMLDVINAGTGRNSATQDKFPRSVLPGTFDFGFATGLSYKDVRLCVDESEALGVPMIVGAAVREMLAVTNAIYGPDSDFTSIVRVVETWAGVEVRSA
ncbi:NAD(P)-dependent oxidoreductase [Paenalcaligenes niemegkensis]|uniref:NAD(P)-dependent oxidoreductase n=1 Tax=Paenalcaligenes niemegkensis TaxID=2895469 RepID=UPI002151A1D3|nr:NAD(P)-dependent oxidoreductase [Paenalcaligenes niemegkensis]MCQ9617021.1 NAD(P)-dependent oxidoreductase [Paenalcaligenes niemegkensis]